LSFARIASRARLIGTAAAVDCSRVAVPTLVVTGEATLDHVVHDDGAVGYASIIPNAEAVVLGRTGHLGFLTRPIALAAIVRQFVDGRAPHRPDVHAQGGPVGPGLSVIHAV
jgi:pimeloyl-ACP methyl ester carboxylesterase